ncbi:MAG TPA: phosphatidate cytidylyltransferase [Acidiferrobacterales bacterium]|jgi:phosphatidate cytidylyltransferase
MLKLRVLTAAVLVPLMVWATFALSTAWLGALMGAFILAAAWEWAALCELRAVPARGAYLAALAALGVALYAVLIAPGEGGGARAAMAGLMAVCVAWWLWVLVELLVFRDPRRGVWMTRPGRLASGLIVLLPAWLAPLWLHAQDGEDGAKIVVFLMALVWVADSAAYFVGRAYGRTKIAPQVSPGKSLEGVLGGLAGVAVLAFASGVLVWKFGGGQLIIWAMIALLATLFSVLGDLTESRVKRVAGVKDSGTLLPGHGGVLDRIDAFTAAAPVFVLAWILWGPAA